MFLHTMGLDCVPGLNSRQREVKELRSLFVKLLYCLLFMYVLNKICAKYYFLVIEIFCLKCIFFPYNHSAKVFLYKASGWN